MFSKAELEEAYAMGCDPFATANCTLCRGETAVDCLEDGVCLKCECSTCSTVLRADGTCRYTCEDHPDQHLDSDDVCIICQIQADADTAATAVASLIDTAKPLIGGVAGGPEQDSPILAGLDIDRLYETLSDLRGIVGRIESERRVA